MVRSFDSFAHRSSKASQMAAQRLERAANRLGSRSQRGVGTLNRTVTPSMPTVNESAKEALPPHESAKEALPSPPPPSPPDAEDAVAAAARRLVQNVLASAVAASVTTPTSAPIVSAPIAGHVPTPPMTIVVDCGSGHTSLFRLWKGPHGIEGVSQALLDEGKVLVGDQGTNPTVMVALGRDVLSCPAGDERSRAVALFVQIFTAQLQALGDDGHVEVFLGATGGVRKLLSKPGDEGTEAAAAFRELEARLGQAVGAERLTLCVLSEEQEAQFEVGSARAACEDIFRTAGCGGVAMASAGGATCQFFHSALESPGHRLSVRADIYEPVEVSSGLGSNTQV